MTGVIVGVTYVHVSDGVREPWRSKTQGSAATAVLSTSTRGLRRAATEQAGPVDMDGVCQLAPLLHCLCVYQRCDDIGSALMARCSGAERLSPSSVSSVSEWSHRAHHCAPACRCPCPTCGTGRLDAVRGTGGRADTGRVRDEGDDTVRVGTHTSLKCPCACHHAALPSRCDS